MVQEQAQQRHQAAVDALVQKLQQDRYVLAALLYGSVARGEAWERSDVDLIIVLRDGPEQKDRSLWLVEDGVNIWADLIPRNQLKRALEGALQGSFWHSLQRHCKLLFSKDESIAAWFAEAGRLGSRDQELQLLRVAADVIPLLDKAEKWFYVQDDLHYSFLWIMHTVNNLARIEVLLNGDVPGREALRQALRYNPAFFQAVYTGLIDGPKDRASIGQALERIDAYLEERAGRLFKPLVDYLDAAAAPRTAAEIGAYFRQAMGLDDLLLLICEWLVRHNTLIKLAVPTRLTRQSQVAVEEPAYYYDGNESR